MDAHMLVSLIAPRPLLLQTGDTDFWSDPKGEWAAAKAASPVYKLLGKTTLESTELPPAGKADFNTLGFVMHADILRLVLELEGRGAGGDPQVWDGGEAIDHLFGEAVGEILLGRVATHIGEREDGD